MWVVTFRQDTLDKGRGTMLAVNGDFSYSRSLNTNLLPDVQAFVSEAKSLFAAHTTEKAEINTTATAIATRLNS